MITSPYPIKTKIKLLYAFMGFQSGRTKCLTQTWNKSKSLYIIKIFKKRQLVSVSGLRMKKMRNTVNSAIAKIVIYVSTKMYRHLRLTLCFLKQNPIAVFRDNFEIYKNSNLKISRIKPSFKQGLTLYQYQPSFQYSKNDLTQRTIVVIAQLYHVYSS